MKHCVSERDGYNDSPPLCFGGRKIGMIFMLVVYVDDAPFLRWRVAARQVLRRLPCGCRKRAAVSRCGSYVPLSGLRRSAVSDCRSCPPWLWSAECRLSAVRLLCRRPRPLASDLCAQSRSLCRFRCSTAGCRCWRRWCRRRPG